MDTLIAASAATLREASIIRIEGDGTIVVTGAAGEEVLCELLVTSGPLPLSLSPRDRVLLWQLDPRDARGIVLGRIGGSHGPTSVPDSLLLEANQSLVLSVGDGSITIREDGKILIKGRDVVSHARRMNRIKGGAVSIN